LAEGNGVSAAARTINQIRQVWAAIALQRVCDLYKVLHVYAVRQLQHAEGTFSVALQELLPGVRVLSQVLETMVVLPQICGGKARQS